MDFSHTTPSSWRRPKLQRTVRPAYVAPKIERTYDGDSGQVYSQMEVHFNRRQYSNWIGEPRTPLLIRKAAPVSGQGVRSLADMARNKMVTQFHSLTAEHFIDVPWHLAKRVWRELLDRRAESFHAWRTLANAYSHPEEFGQRENRYLLDIRQPQLPLADYLTGITSPELNWMTCLRISPKQLSTTDLVSIHKVTNLAVLDLSDGQVTIDNMHSTFDHRVMRAWGELATSRQAFQHLRVFMFGWQENLSEWIFQYVDQFPSLCQIIVTDCPQMHQKNRGEWEHIALRAGWEGRHAKKSAKSLRPVLGDPTFYSGSVSGCYYENMERFESLAPKRRPNVKHPLPLLEVWIGSPRQWSHIMEDFPSTRTIIFDNVKTSSSWVESTDNKESLVQHGDREGSKRARNSDMLAQGSGLPPLKRGATTARPMRKRKEKNVGDMLEEFMR